MNNIYSPTETYYPRWLAPLLQQAIEEAAVLVLTGARQVGKSTLLRNETPFRDWRFLSMDDFDVLRQAHQQPEALWAGTDRIILDEVQKAPDLLAAVKQVVDRSREKPSSFYLGPPTCCGCARSAKAWQAGQSILF